MAAGAWAGASPEAGRALEYDRAAVESGEVLRVLTCHLVHWTPRMALADLGALLVLGGWLEWRRRGLAVLALAGGAALAGGGIHFILTEISVYRGASGLDSALFVALAASLFSESGSRPVRWIAAGAGALFLAKVAAELVTGRALAAGPLPPGVTVTPEVHLLGASAGFLAWRSHHLGRIRRAILRASGGGPRSGSSS